jgi:hypothetical protein
MTNRKALNPSGDDCKGALPLTTFQELCPLITATSLNLPKDLPFEKWLEIGKALARVESGVQWYVGDWWAFGKHEYGKRYWAAKHLSVDAHTCENYAGVCRAFRETSRRREGLSFGHHQAVAAEAQKRADELLDWCLAQEPGGKRRSISDLRFRVSRLRQQDIPPEERERASRAALDAAKRDLGFAMRDFYAIHQHPLFEPRAQLAKPEVELDTSPGGGPVPDELRNLQPEPPVQPDHVAIAWAAIAKLSPDEVEKWVATASSKELEEIRATLEALLARLRCRAA